MKIGYACLNVGVRNLKYRSVTLKYIDKLEEVIVHNLETLKKQMLYNVENNIKMFRISSDLIPFGGSKANEVDWRNKYVQNFKEIGDIAKKNNIRLSMHPGQYTVINSPREEVVQNSINELNYHADVLKLMGINGDIILHIGGVYGDKISAIDRFINNYNKLNEEVKKRLIIENDDKSYTIEDILRVSSISRIPVVFDNLHHKINTSLTHLSEKEILDICLKTWTRKPKVHYSDQALDKKIGSHSERINVENFVSYLKNVGDIDFDIMLEVKDKNLSAKKCSNILKKVGKKELDIEWSIYKYKVLEKSQNIYLEIRELLKEKPQALDFYRLIDESLQLEDNIAQQKNAIEHIWGHFKNMATEKEKVKVMKLLQNNDVSKSKKELEKLAIKYNDKYLLKSYYFLI